MIDAGSAVGDLSDQFFKRIRHGGARSGAVHDAAGRHCRPAPKFHVSEWTIGIAISISSASIIDIGIVIDIEIVIVIELASPFSPK